MMIAAMPLGRLLHSSPPPAAVCYFGVSLSGFYAFGTGVADNVLLAFEGTSHAWVIAAANFMVVLHVAAAFQVRACEHLHGMRCTSRAPADCS